MTIDTVNTPSSFLKDVDPDTGAAFRTLRDAIGRAGPLDHAQAELIILAGFVTAGFEDPFKIHALRMVRQGMTAATLRHMVLLLLGASLPMYPAARALDWIDVVMAQHAAETGVVVDRPRQEKTWQ